MKKYTAETLTAEGYKLENALIKNVSLSSQLIVVSLLI